MQEHRACGSLAGCVTKCLGHLAHNKRATALGLCLPPGPVLPAQVWEDTAEPLAVAGCSVLLRVGGSGALQGHNSLSIYHVELSTGCLRPCKCTVFTQIYK